MRLTYVSLFSGIEAFSVAASRIGDVEWEPVFFSEIEPFPCAVLAERFPNVPNLGDICNIRADAEKGIITNGTTTIPFPDGGLDILGGGSPCQDVSVAGKRAGMQEGSGTRSSLAFEYSRLVAELRPRILLWENVPGVLSSNGGLDFAAFLRSLVELGYGIAWRVLDAQWTRVDGFPRAIPQRRRRVWVVGCIGGDERIPAKILFEHQGVLGNTPPRREAGKGFAGPIGYRPAQHDRIVADTAFDCLRRGLYGTGGANGTLKAAARTESDSLVVSSVERPSTAPEVCKTLSAEGFDGMPDIQKGNGQPVVATAIRTANTGANGCGISEEAAHTLDLAQGQAVIGIDGFNQELTGDTVGTLGVNCGTSTGRNGVAYGFSHVASGAMLDCQPKTVGVPLKRSPGGEGAAVLGFLRGNSGKSRSDGIGIELAPTLIKSGGEGGNKPCAAIGFKAGQSANGGLGAEEEVCPTQQSTPSALEPTVAHGMNFCAASADDHPPMEELSPTCRNAVHGENAVVMHHIVRRLAPTECERLQGFPDGWTLVAYRGKAAEECPDSPRYKSIGNSWATNCAEWALRRIVAAFRLGLLEVGA